MKLILLLIAAAVCGCSYSKPIKGTNLRAVHVGGVLRPGITIVVADSCETNLPTIISQASGPAVAGNLLGTATGAAAGFFAGYAVGDNNHDGNTTVIQGEPREGPMIPPTPPPTSSRPPFGPPPWHGGNPHNKGR